MDRAGTKYSFGEGFRLTLVAAVAVLLLSVQVGLTFHGAAHVHDIDQAGDCEICDLGSHFVAEPASAQDHGILPRMASNLPPDALPFPDSYLQAPLARGPPSTAH